MNRCSLGWLACLLGFPAALLAGSIEGTVKAVGVRDARDVVLYIAEAPGKAFEPPREHAVMDQKAMTFIPHVLPVLKGTKVDFPNNDTVDHNVYSVSEPKKFNLGLYPPASSFTLDFDQPGVVVLLCNVHPDMLAFVVALSNPYFAKTERDGKYRIDKVPPGSYVLKTWHEKLKPFEQPVVIKADEAVTLDITLTR